MSPTIPKHERLFAGISQNTNLKGNPTHFVHNTIAMDNSNTRQTTSVSIIEDSLAPNGQRLITFSLRYWRAIHAEFMTHRVFSRNAASSRAIPTQKLLEQVAYNPAGPILFGLNQAGMQSGDWMDEDKARYCRLDWLQDARMAANQVERDARNGMHKQFCNRKLEPYMYIETVLTATEYDGWFELRDHKDAQPEIMVLARMMRMSMNASTPKQLLTGEWHLPYVLNQEKQIHSLQSQIKISTARCSRVSYMNHEGKQTTPEEDFKQYDRLITSTPCHASPIEHQGMALDVGMGGYWSNNFKGFLQYRDLLEREATRELFPIPAKHLGLV